MKKLLALCLGAILLLTGCMGYLPGYLNREPVAYEDMVYTRPEPEKLEEALERVCSGAIHLNASRLMGEVDRFYTLYDSYITNWILADLRYSADLTDEYWQEEYRFCSETVSQVDVLLERLYRALAVCPVREDLEEQYFGEGFFDAYEGEPVYDQGYLDLTEEEARLENEYYAISQRAQETEPYSEEYYSTYGGEMAGLLAQLVQVRRELAEYMGYDSYAQYAYELYFYRDYTPQEGEAYLVALGQALTPLYVRWYETQGRDWATLTFCSQEETFAYVKEAAANMGGAVQEAFRVLEQKGLYDIGYGENKYPASFEVYLWSYGAPFVFLCPYEDQSDKLILAHEFGHFANDYVCGGSYAGTDVAEVHSQAFEYLSLCYTENAEELTRYKLAESLATFVECAAYALFEHRLYALEEPTAEAIHELYRDTCREFGFDAWQWDSRDFVDVTHFFTEPMYMISYTVSNDLALQVYSRELEAPGQGLALYQQLLTGEDSYLVEFASRYGLESPFAPDRPQELANILSQGLE